MGTLVTKPGTLLLSVIMTAGLTTACEQNAANVGDAAQIEAETQAKLESIAVSSTPLSDVDIAPAALEATAVEVTRVSAPEQVAKATGGPLPLRLGQYVRTGTPCDRAGSADRLALVTRTGMSLNCTFKTIDQTGPTTYQVTSECSDGGAAWGRDEGVETRTEIYEIPNETSFTVTYEGGSQNSARFCVQVSAGEL